MEPHRITNRPAPCACGGRLARWEASIICRSCGTVYAMFLSMETRSPAKYQLPEGSRVSQTLPRLQASV